MIYILGMSHIFSVLDACSINGIDEQLPKIMNSGAPTFSNWEIKPDILPAKVMAASIYIRQIAPHWGHVLAQMLEPGIVGIAPGYRNLLASIDKLEAGNILFAFLHGEEYHHMCIRPYNAPYDFEIPWRSDLTLVADRQIIPYEIVDRLAADHLKKSAANLHALRTCLPNLRIVNVICPPPSDAGETDTPSTHSVRFKNYLVYAKLLRESTERAGIEILPPPIEALTSIGLLRKEYAADPVHGNKNYGELVLAQIRNFCQEKQ